MIPEKDVEVTIKLSRSGDVSRLIRVPTALFPAPKQDPEGMGRRGYGRGYIYNGLGAQISTYLTTNVIPQEIPSVISPSPVNAYDRRTSWDFRKLDPDELQILDIDYSDGYLYWLLGIAAEIPRYYWPTQVRFNREDVKLILTGVTRSKLFGSNLEASGETSQVITELWKPAKAVPAPDRYSDTLIAESRQILDPSQHLTNVPYDGFKVFMSIDNENLTLVSPTDSSIQRVEDGPLRQFKRKYGWDVQVFDNAAYWIKTGTTEVVHKIDGDWLVNPPFYLPREDQIDTAGSGPSISIETIAVAKFTLVKDGDRPPLALYINKPQGNTINLVRPDGRVLSSRVISEDAGLISGTDVPPADVSKQYKAVANRVAITTTPERTVDGPDGTPITTTAGTKTISCFVSGQFDDEFYEHDGKIELIHNGLVYTVTSYNKLVNDEVLNMNLEL